MRLEEYLTIFMDVFVSEEMDTVTVLVTVKETDFIVYWQITDLYICF